jgi:hypothetical protein
MASTEGGISQRYTGADMPQPEEQLQETLLPPEPKKHEGIDLLRMFPAAFTMVCFLVYLVPAWLILTAARTPALSYFASNGAYVVIAVPLIILLVHFIHLRSGNPVKFGVIAALIIPALILLIYGNMQHTNAIDKQDKLFSTDCDTFPAKRRLQVAWEAAYNLYMQCLEDTAATSNYSVSVLQANFRLQDCQEYQAQLNPVVQYGSTGMSTQLTGTYAQEWNYLRYLEENHFCSGWCYAGVQLWSNQMTKDLQQTGSSSKDE